MNKLRMWLTQSTTEQKEALALAADSSVASIRLAAKGYRKDGEVDISVDFADRLERATAAVGGNLPVVKREDLNTTCKACPYQLKCNAQN